MSTISAYLQLDGCAAEAAEFYRYAFSTKPAELMFFGDMPPQPGAPAMPEEMKTLVMHGELHLFDTTLMVSDVPPGYRSTIKGNQISIAIQSTNLEALRLSFTRLAEKGVIQQPLMETFFSPLYGEVTDRFGIPWMMIGQR